MKSVAPPLNIAQLNARLERASQDLGVPVSRVRRMLCTLVVSQMLPDAVAVKGGMGVKLRKGERGTRATADLDVSTQQRGEAFERKFGEQLARGWGEVPASKGVLRKNPNSPDRVAFTGIVKRRRLHDPGLAQPQYVMHPYKVTLSFLGREWAGLDLEVSDPEIDPDAYSRQTVDGELTELNGYFGFGKLQPVDLIDLEYQIAQKMHAVTDPDYHRAHDLVDLQLLWDAAPARSAVWEYCVRIFDFRRAQPWPPLPLRAMDGWELAYSAARAETQIDGSTLVLENLDAARAWFEQIIASIEAAGSKH